MQLSLSHCQLHLNAEQVLHISHNPVDGACMKSGLHSCMHPCGLTHYAIMGPHRLSSPVHAPLLLTGVCVCLCLHV
jgi:hypothetical protein